MHLACGFNSRVRQKINHGRHCCSTIVVLDFLLSELEARFKNHAKLIESLQKILPRKCSGIDSNDLSASVLFYHKLLPDSSSVHAEFSVWQMKWLEVKVEDRPSSAIEAFAACKEVFFPNIKILLGILATLPVSTATAERSFSTLKRIKSYIRNSSSETRLNGLGLMSIHRDIPVDPQEVIQRFALQPRRLNFIF